SSGGAGLGVGQDDGAARPVGPCDFGAIVPGGPHTTQLVRRPQSSGRDHRPLVARAAAVAAAGRADSTRSSACPSWAADRNHASNALGGRCTPASSMLWKKAA